MISVKCRCYRELQDQQLNAINLDALNELRREQWQNYHGNMIACRHVYDASASTHRGFSVHNVS
jgi:hypothetical protein